jgi:uncharacterized protein YjbJ (UPF0337 family)
VRFRQTFRKPSLGLVTLLCTALRAITTSYQQSDSPIVVDTRLCIGQGNFPNEGLTWSQTGKAQGNVHELQRTESNHRTEERIMMKSSTDDKTTGKFHEVKGAIKQKAGELTKNPNLEANGRAEKNAGKVQKAVGKIEKAVGA